MARSVIDELVIDNPKEATKIVFLVLDGASGIPFPGVGKSALQLANKPNLDALAAKSVTGLMDPVAPGVTPGSGPGHLAVFGYDPVADNIGRGVLEALGIGMELTERDTAARCNFATVDADGILIDRRAGRIPTEDCVKLCKALQAAAELSADGVEVIIEPVKEHRFAVVFRGEGLGETGYPPGEFSVTRASRAAKRTVSLLRKLMEQLKPVLDKESESYPQETRPNAILFRGFSRFKKYPSMLDRFGLRCLAVANYPMYRGVARLLGMDIHPVTKDVASQFQAVKTRWKEYDYFFVHVKYTDKHGEDGNLEAKAGVIEEVDALMPVLAELDPNVLVVTSDHSTPAALAKHSWHPVATMLFSHHSVKQKDGKVVDTVTCRPDAVTRFDEVTCAGGGLGRQPLMNLMGIALAHAGRLEKYGA